MATHIVGSLLVDDAMTQPRMKMYVRTYLYRN